MNRRDFLKTSTGGATVVSMGVRNALPSPTASKAGSSDPISTPGERYEAVVPDTLDLTDRAALAIRPLLGFADSREIDPRVTTDRATCGPKYLEALALVRTMTGNEDNLHEERRIMDSYLGEIAEDGLFEVPPQGPFSEPWGNILGQGRLMLAWMAWHGRDGDDQWLKRIESLYKGIESITLYKDDYAYYPTEMIFDARYVFCFRKSGWKVKDEAPPVYLMKPGQKPDMGDREGHQVDARMGIHAYVSGPLRPLARWQRMSSNTHSLDLAQKLARYLSSPGLWVAFGEPPELGGSYQAHYSGHVHAHTMTLRGLLEYANSANNQQLKLFCRDGYEYTRQFGLSRFGYIPEWTNNNLCEGCQIADMTALAIRLSDAGVGDYWDDVDSYVRNHLVEQQHTKPGQKYFGVFCAGTYPTHLRVDDYAGCCTANCSDALYYAWESISRRGDGVATVNLLLNRASTWLDIDSYLPYEGKVVLKNRATQSILVRIPGWVDKNTVRVRGKKGNFPLAWAGNYLSLAQVPAQDEITLEFAVVETLESYKIPGDINQRTELFGLQPMPIEVDRIPKSRMDWDGIWYTCRFRANTLISIVPERRPPSLAEVKGGVEPLYQRQDYQKDNALLIKKTRFAPYKVLDW
jgi:hypothetical protein